MQPEQCERCGSERVVPDAVLADQGQNSDGQAKVWVHENPQAWFMKGTKVAAVKGAVCCDCGHLKLHCEGDLNALWEAWLKSQQRPEQS